MNARLKSSANNILSRLFDLTCGFALAFLGDRRFKHLSILAWWYYQLLLGAAGHGYCDYQENREDAKFH